MQKKHLLMTPGPTPVPERALLAQARGMIHHRGPEYGEIITRVVENLKYVFQTERDVFIFTSSGTGAMESAVVNLFSPNDKVIVASTGNFGERWANIASAYGLDVVKLEFEWGTRADVETIRKAIEENPDAKGVLCTHSETSTGAVNDVRAIAELTRDKDMVVVVDAVSGLGACELRTDEWGLDVVVSGSQKALMAPPGLAFATVSEKAWRFVENSRLPKFYFDYRKYQASIRKDPPQSPFTPAISTMLALGESLQMIRDEGLENIWKKHIVFGRAVRAAIKAIGLALFSPDDDSSAAVTAVYPPDGIDPKTITTMMRVEYGITIAGGQGKVKGRIFRIGHCGYFQRSDIITTIDALESVLERLGYRFEKGSGVLAAQEVFDREGIY